MKKPKKPSAPRRPVDGKTSSVHPKAERIAAQDIAAKLQRVKDGAADLHRRLKAIRPKQDLARGLRCDAHRALAIAYKAQAIANEAFARAYEIDLEMEREWRA